MKRTYQQLSLIILVCGLAAGVYGILSVAASAPRDLIARIEHITWNRNRDNQGTTWFLPRLCVLPSPQGAQKFMTLQWIKGSDYYGPVQWQEVRGDGADWQTWSALQPVPGFGRRPYAGGIEEAVSDVMPQYHPNTKSIIALGHIVYYRDGKYFPEQPQRYPVYVVRDAKGNWSSRQRLEWNDPRGSALYTAGGAQWLILPNGDALIPMSFRPKERADYGVTTALCSFDGKELKLKQVGNELRNTVKRGLLEPSLVHFRGQYFLTIRAEDGFGYVNTSKDGLQWSEPVAWKFDDGEALAMSTTQQHWLAHSEGLFLVYTRKTAENEKVMRWRSPLFIARVNEKTQRLIRATERTVFPLYGDPVNRPNEVPHYGNFHTVNINASESWITVGEVIPANFGGDLLLARVHWAKPNRLQ
ncbi:MAG: exo-alpha-sialidase [Acidobacteria bacterium]|nr:exo-alpha-sialidase [Acidobacteriota bacterium]